MKTFKAMEAEFYKQVRGELIAGLALLPPDNHRIFKIGYSRNARKRPTDEDLEKPIVDIVRDMPNEKLDWAMQQVQRTLDKR